MIPTNVRLATLAALAMLALWTLGCGAQPSAANQATPEMVTGQVLDVGAISFTELSSLVVEDSAGTTWHFKARRFRGYSPSHLREHMVLGLPVNVTFHRDNGALIIDDVADVAQ